MKFKYLKMVLAMAFLVVVLAACGSDNGNTDTESEAPAATENVETEASEEATEPTGEANDVNVALVAHSPDSILNDGSFNQGAWDGIQRFADAHGLSDDAVNFFQPSDASDEARIDMIELAIDGGANILILPGFHFEQSLYNAQDMFPDTTFVLLDASPRLEGGDVRVENNVAAIHYAEEEAGFLAGYAAVLEGYRDLGFMGGLPVPAVVRFGHGFIQGAEHAAYSLGLEEGDVTINYMYLGGFAPDPAHTTTAAAWYAAGTEVIFVAAGGAGSSVMAAAESAGASVIGVDVDQHHLSPDTVITSAIKGLDVSVYDMLTGFMNGNFNGGGELRFDASITGVGLAMDNAQFTNFTMDQYEAIFATLADGEIEVNSSTEMSDISVSLVTVVEQ